jgi:hypothetical protein
MKKRGGSGPAGELQLPGGLDVRQKVVSAARMSASGKRSERQSLVVPLPGGPVLDAGAIEHGEDLLTVHPPSISLFDQVLERVTGGGAPSRQTPDPERMGLGATALCLRWGSYLAVLLDETRPRDPQAGKAACSLIAEDEMRRINIEFSANLSRLLELLHRDEAAVTGLIEAAATELPLPGQRVGIEEDFLEPYLALLSAVNRDKEWQSRLAGALPAVRQHPWRILANSLVLQAYRNGPVEEIHAGRTCSYSLVHRRATEAESREIVRFTARCLAAVFAGLRPWKDEGGYTLPWPDVLAGVAISPWLTPRSWTLTEESCPVRLPLSA